MSLLFLVEDDEILSYHVGGEPPPMQAGEAPDLQEHCILYYKRLLPSKQALLTRLYTERGLTKTADYNRAVIAISLTGWTNVIGKDAAGHWAQMTFPVIAATEMLAGTDLGDETALERELLQRHHILRILEKIPANLLFLLSLEIQSPAPEQILKNFSAALNGSSNLLTLPPGTATLAPNAATNAENLANVSPVTEAA